MRRASESAVVLVMLAIMLGTEVWCRPEPDQLTSELGNLLVRHQIQAHVESVLSRLSGVSLEYGVNSNANMNNIPVFSLLNLTKRIMQNACAAVSAQFFELAFHTFVGLHTKLLAKEPYLRYDTYQRILLALRTCFQRSSPHIFHQLSQKEELSETESCEHTQDTSQQALVFSRDGRRRVHNFSIPLEAQWKVEGSGAGGLYAEPLIETVWKMLVHAQSYCFEHFGEQYNDHHAFTHLIPHLFDSRISEVWLKGYPLVGTHGTQLYGGLLGNLTRILGDVDNCVGAASSASPYPWLISRPTFNGANARTKVWGVATNASAKPTAPLEPDTPTRISGRRMGAEFELEHSSEHQPDSGAPHLHFIEE